MAVEFELSVMQVGNSLRITIPKEVARHLKIRKGDKLRLWVNDNRIVAEKKREKTK